VASFAPAKYSGNCGPGTLEMSTLISVGSRSASLARLASAARPDSSQGAPSDGKSVGNERTLPICCLACCVPLWMLVRRAARSAISVHRLTSIVDTWLLASVLPGARSDTGTAAISGLSGLQS
jgi:hypothetical protein